MNDLNKRILFKSSKKTGKIEVRFGLIESNHINHQLLNKIINKIINNNKQKNNGIIETITHNRQIERTS